MDLQQKDDDKQLIAYNKFVTEQKILYPALTVDEITKKFYETEKQKEIYKDKYFDLMYKKLSKSLKF